MSSKKILSNVRLENQFVFEGDRVAGTETKVAHLQIEDGLITGILEGKIPEDDAPVLDAGGLLALPSFYEKHIHLDKGHYGGPWKACTPFVSVSERIEEETRFLPEFLAFTTRRAERVLQLITGYGATFARVHCNVDPVVGLGNMERVRMALENHKDRLEYELVAFPQHGLLRADTIRYMKEAMRSGVKVVGGLDPATIDNDIESSLNTMFDIAVEFDAEIDIHLHNGGSLGMNTIGRLVHLVEEAKWQGKVNISHAYCLGDSPVSEVRELAESLVENRISIATTAPIDVPSPPIPLLSQQGVEVHIINDNIHDHWSPFGSGDLLERASRMAEKFGLIDEYSLSRAYGYITGGKTPLDSEGNCQWPRIGDKADLVLVDASCSAEAVARVSDRKAVLFRGNIVSGGQ